jgi:tetratricopeptide (TPR) repeat protein
MLDKIKEFISGHIKITFFICVALLSFAIYAQTLKYGFTYLDDSILILDNYELISDYKNIAKIFSTSVFNNADAFYRPVLTLSFMAGALAGGKDLHVYRLTQILLHIAAVFLIFILMLKIGVDKYFAFVLTLLFCAHPAFVCAVAWIPGRNDSLLAVFIVLSLIFLLDYLSCERKKTLRFFLFAFSFSAALLTKETAAAAAVLFPFFIWAFVKNTDKKRLIPAFLFLAFSVILYMLIRNIALGASGLNSSPAYTLISHAGALPYYFECAVIPFRIKLIAQKMSVEPLTVVSFCVCLIPLISAFFFNIGNKKKILFSTLWFFLLLLPSLMMNVQILYTHRLYVPLIGAITAYGVFFEILSGKYEIIKKYLFFLIFSLVLIFSFASYMQSKKFQGEAVFVATALSESPDSYFVRSMAAKYYLKKGMARQALGTLEKAGVNAAMARADIIDYFNTLGYALVIDGKYDDALKSFNKVLALDDKNENALNNLAYIYLVTKNYDKAAETVRLLTVFYPQKRKYMDYYEDAKSKSAQLNIKL